VVVEPQGIEMTHVFDVASGRKILSSAVIHEKSERAARMVIRRMKGKGCSHIYAPRPALCSDRRSMKPRTNFSTKSGATTSARAGAG
jgi:hypothetical protein